MKVKYIIAAFVLLLVSLTGSNAADWQWSVEVDAITIGRSQEHPRAFLWIPPACKYVHAVVFAQNNMIEEGILQHPDFRKMLSQLGVAEILVAPTFDTWQSATNNDTANERFNGLLKQLAEESGYKELEFAPVIPMGHSAMASFPWNFAVWNPQRTLAVLSVHGDAPQTALTGNGRPNLDWGDRNIDGIPGLMVMGEYEWSVDRLTPAVVFHAKHPDAPIAVVCDSGHGHFDYSDELVHFLSIFIRKAVEQRLPAGALSNGPIALKPVSARDGWLMDCYHKGERPRAKAAPFAKYTGDRNEAFWCFDGQMARAAENFNPQYGKQPQLVGFVQDGKIVGQTPNTHPQVFLKLPPLGDDLTFKLTGTFLDSVPSGTRPAMWTGLTNGAPLSHANDGVPVKLSRISGPVEQLAPDTFAIRFNRLSIDADRRTGDIWLLASHPGDAEYKSAVQQGLLQIPFALKEGRAQQITFTGIPDQKAGIKFLKLSATSDAGAPVYFYMREGPAEINGDTLVLTKIPPRAKYPIRVTVVAWQYGRTIKPKLQSAKPVLQTFYIVK